MKTTVVSLPLQPVFISFLPKQDHMSKTTVTSIYNFSTPRSVLRKDLSITYCFSTSLHILLNFGSNIAEVAIYPIKTV